jgi:hypothetical protein
VPYFTFSPRTKPLLNAAENEGLFVRRQTFAFPAQPKCFSRGCIIAFLPLG